MFIFYKDNKFNLEINFKDYEPNEWEELTNLLKRLYISFDFPTKNWLIDNKRIDEILLWFERYNISYILQDSAKEQLEVIKNSYKREIEIYRDRKFDDSILNKNIKSYQYQLDCINWHLSRNAALNSYQAGLGKTFISICTYGTLFNKDLIDGMIIVIPNGLGYHWKYEILDFVNLFKEDDIEIIDNKTKKQPFDNFKDKKILIVPNHLLSDLLLSYNSKKFKSSKYIRWNRAFVDIKKEWKKNNLGIIVDEAHILKHSKALRTKATHSIKDQFNYKLLLTATPAINDFAGFYSQLTFLDHSIIPMSENAFRIYISKSIGDKWGLYNITSYDSSHVQEIKNKMKHVFTQKLKADLPEIKTKLITEIVHLDITSLQKQLYQEIVEQEIGILLDEYDTLNYKLILSKLQIICEVFDNPELMKKRNYINPLLNLFLKKWKFEDDPKYLLLRSRVESIIDELDEKLIVYDHHPFTLDTLYDKFKKYNPLIIHGSLKDIKDKEKDRHEKEKLFNFDKKHKIIFLSSLTSSQGINLQHGGHRIIVYNTPFDATLFKQLSERTDRANSTQDSILEIFNYSRTLDNIRVMRALNRVNFNDKLGKELSKDDLSNLLRGII